MTIRNCPLERTLGVAVAGCLSLAATAQQEAPGAPPGMLEEVVVTAQKRSESLQDTPISILALGAQQLEAYGITNVSDLAGITPSLSIDPFPLNTGTLRMFIRGVGITDAQITQDPAVAVYLDGAYIARSTGLAMDIADLQRIEVLRGPQGTLYGRNATGGAVNLITRPPNTQEVEFSQKIGVDDRDGYTLKTTLNVPVTDGLAAKVSWLRIEQDGFVENLGPGGSFGDHTSEGGRFDVRWEVNDRLTLDYGYDTSEVNRYTYTYQVITPNEGGLFGPNFAGRVEASDNRLDELTTTSPLLPTDTDIDGHLFRASWLATQDAELRYLFSSRSLDEKNYFDMGGGLGLFDYRLDNGAYQSHDGTISVPVSRVVTDQDQSSHELQLLGSLWGSRLEYIAGAYYFEEDGVERKASGGVGHLLTAPFSTLPADPGFERKVLLTSLGGFDIPIRNEAWAVYTRLKWTPPVFGDRLHLTVGGRHSDDSREAQKNQRSTTIFETIERDLDTGEIRSIGTTVTSAEFNRSESSDFDDDSFDFIAEYDLSDDVNVYAKWSEAYKAGGFNTRDPDPDRFSEGFDPEKVETTEVGLKSEWFGRLRLNAAIFRTDYKDIQVNFLLPSSPNDTQVVNAGKAEISGAEMDLVWLLSGSATFTLNYAYLDAEMKKVVDPETGGDATDQFRFSMAPEHAFTAAVDYSWQGLDWADIDVHLSYAYTDDRAGSGRAVDGDLTELGSYGVLGLRTALSGVRVLDGNLTLAAWMHNALDEEYEISAVTQQPVSNRSVLWGEPRSYGLEIVYDYR